jgi:hypothetical protein
MRKLSSFLATPADRQGSQLYRWDATWFVVLLIASVWGLSTHEMWWGCVNLLVAGLYLASLAATVRLRYWQRRSQKAESENERFR